MYNKIKPQKTSLKRNVSYQGERIEEKITRIVNNKEPIKDGAPRIYTERKDGVMPAYNIKTDRWEAAVDAMSVVDKVHKAKREERATIGEQAKQGMQKENETGGQSLQGT